MEDYHFHCFHTSWETAELFLKAGLPGHAASHTLTLSVPHDYIHGTGSTVREGGQHYLDACFRCGRLLGRNKDIFMYRCDTPFCSEECRQQEIDADVAKERRRSSKQPAATATKRETEPEQQRQSSDPQTIQVWALSIVY